MSRSGNRAAFGVPCSSISPMTAPILTVVPSGTLTESTPSTSAFNSMVILSVSISQRGSSFATLSPSFLCHLATSASITDSPTSGTFISIAFSNQPETGTWHGKRKREILLRSREL